MAKPEMNYKKQFGMTVGIKPKSPLDDMVDKAASQVMMPKRKSGAKIGTPSVEPGPVARQGMPRPETKAASGKKPTPTGGKAGIPGPAGKPPSLPEPKVSLMGGKSKGRSKGGGY
jgi:hypothetical protein